MTSLAPAAVTQVIDKFFGPQNDAQRAEADEFITLFRRTGAAVFPYRRGATTCWYAFATDASVARKLRDELAAFIGPSWTTWTGPGTSLDPKLPVESVLSAIARGPVIRLDPLPGADGQVEHALRLLSSTLASRPDLVENVPRPRYRMLSDLELAFATANSTRARELLDEIAATGSLGAVNLLFLEIRALEASADYAAVLANPDLPDLLRRRRPRSVTFAIARSVQATTLGHHEQRWLEGDPAAAKAAIDEFSELSADFQQLFSDQLLRDQHQLRSALVAHHLLRNEIRAAEALLEDLTPEERAWPQALILAAIESSGVPAQTEADTKPIDTSRSIRSAFESGAYQDVLEQAVGVRLELRELGYVVRAAYNLDTLEAADEALAILADASASIIQEARSDRSFAETERRIRDLRMPNEEATDAVHSWREWFVTVAVSPPSSDALAVAERGKYEWSADEIREANSIEALASAILRCGSSDIPTSHSIAIAGLAHLADWIDELGVAAPVEIIDAALDLLLYGGASSVDRDNLSIRFFEALVTSERGTEFDKRLDDFGDLWNDVAAPRRLDWPIALLDIAVDFAGRANAVRKFLGVILASIALWPDRLDRSQATTLRSICQDLGEDAACEGVLGEVRSEPDDIDPLEKFAGKTIGVYTLTPGVRHRVVEALRVRCPSIDVEVNSDLVSTSALRALAKRADVMIVALQSAKHAATDAIVAVRGRDNIVAAKGRGSVGIIRTLEEHAPAA